MGVAVDTLIWIIAGVLLAIWLVGFILGAGLWIHALLIASILLAFFDILDHHNKSKPKSKPR